MAPGDDETPSLWQWVPVATSLAGSALSLYGGDQAAKGSIDAGNASLAAGRRSADAYRSLGVRQATSDRIKAARTKAADEFAATQYETNAGQQIAASQRTAIEERRQANLVSSRAIAIAAASGAGASDTSVVSILGRIKGEGAYRASVALYSGEDKARVLRSQAAAKRYEGLTAEEAGELNAQDAIATNEAKAVSEEAKGEAAAAAGRVGANTARTRGVAGALPGLTALAIGASLLSKYGKDAPDSTDTADAGATVDPNSAENINAGLTNDSASLESIVSAENDAAYYDAASGMAAPASDFAMDYEWASFLL